MFTSKKSIPIMATVVTFVAVVIMLRLGFWQLDRMDTKQARLSSLQQKLEAGHSSLVSLDNNLQQAADTPVAFVGNPNVERMLYLDNRIVGGAVGYEVLIPVQTNIGWILVNLGWIKATDARRTLPEITVSSASREFVGNIVIPTLNPMVKETASAQDGFPLLIQQVDLSRLAALTGLTLQPFIVALESDPQSIFKNNWQPVVMPPEKHFGYAIQWFGLAIAAVAIYLIALFRRKSD
jgi:cytochrome oxidase assembly protein ShyY1